MGTIPLAHDFIELSLRTQGRIFEVCSELYSNGLSLRDIEERTGISKTAILTSFKEEGFTTRDKLTTLANGKRDQKFKGAGVTRYGFAYLDGKLIVDPKEQLVIRKILKLHKEGRSSNAIAKELKVM